MERFSWTGIAEPLRISDKCYVFVDLRERLMYGHFYFVIAVEQENDLLVCGECQTSFPLHDILKFIRHKVNKCNQKITDALDTPEFEDGHQSDPEQHCGNISSKRTSISAPISLKESIENNKSPRSSIDSLGSLKDVRIKEENGPSPSDEDKLFDQKISRSPLKPRKVVDAESNTTNTGRSITVLHTWIRFLHLLSNMDILLPFSYAPTARQFCSCSCVSVCPNLSM